MAPRLGSLCEVLSSSGCPARCCYRPITVQPREGKGREVDTTTTVRVSWKVTGQALDRHRNLPVCTSLRLSTGMVSPASSSHRAISLKHQGLGFSPEPVTSQTGRPAPAERGWTGAPGGGAPVGQDPTPSLWPGPRSPSQRPGCGSIQQARLSQGSKLPPEGRLSGLQLSFPEAGGPVPGPQACSSGWPTRGGSVRRPLTVRVLPLTFHRSSRAALSR